MANKRRFRVCVVIGGLLVTPRDGDRLDNLDHIVLDDKEEVRPLVYDNRADAVAVADRLEEWYERGRRHD